ncbi:phage tail protein [Kitasatospora azatica]|uniref:phage tail protein n=1 Tax=Kitasatospora azatica TaxID=58347 RepID=UPI0006896103|nr:phage tail protein [Kitasatospora azatica]
MAQKSSYLQYLPPVLWRDDPQDPEFSLGGLLRIFEKLLTGVPDGAVIRHGGHTHPPIGEQIDRLDRLFDPWQTPAPFLPYLASWVALEFPTLQGEPLWDEYQQRRAIAAMVRIYRRRGLRGGLNDYLDLYSSAAIRPRIALDDGSRVLTVTPDPVAPTAPAPVAALVSQGPVLQGTALWAEGVVRPWTAAVGADGSVFLGDIGVPAGVALPIRNRVWRISPAGHYDLGPPPKATPRPLAVDTLALSQVCAVAVRPARSGRPETLYVLDRPGKLSAVAAPYVGVPAVAVTSVAASGTVSWPVAMTVDGNGNLLVLDRGAAQGFPSAPTVITVDLAGPTVSRTALHTVVEPLSLLVRPDGSLLVGDGGPQDPADAGQYPGNLVLVDRSNPASWTETPLLPAANPLTAPTGLALLPDGGLYVLDAGLKPIWPAGQTAPFVLSVAEPAAVHRVDLGATVPTVVRVTEPGRFVYPTGMATDGHRLLVCDPGQHEVPHLDTFWPRVRPYRFDAVIHFADPRLPSDPTERQLALNRAYGDIRTIVEQERPAHTLVNLITEI